GNVQGPPNCIVTGTNIARIMFYINDVWTNTDGNASNGWGCWIDTTKYKDGAYTLKAVAYNAAGQTTTITHPVTIQNGTTTTTPNAAPTVGITTPGSGATLAGTSVPYTLTAGDTDGTVASVELKLISGSTTKVVASKTAAPWSGTFSTSGLPNGAATLMATATDNLGKATSVQRAVSINNTVVSNPGDTGGGGSTGSIAPEHIISKARADMAFSSQTGYHSQVMGKSTQAASIPESGITGPVLPNGETLRLGKVNDPAGSGAKVFSFQVHPSDPVTSGSKRAEFAFASNIEMDKVYWVAVSTFIPDWGTLNSGDDALFGTQMHSGDNSRSLSPSFGLYTSPGGRNFKVVARWSTSSDPQQGNSTKATYAERPIPFGRWADFVLKFKHNTSGNGFLQVWMNGELIATHNGNLGFNTPGFKDYAKFGYYNWSSGMNSSRKVILRSPTIVADPTGSTYTAAQVRSLLGASPDSAASGGSTTTTATTGGTTTTADSGVCSSASCVLTQ
ncbi:MAG TPA: heparin lyase I family protein, partial [Xanthobacteraceae bacterium]|nr:heparin lyase I family protein [Xanthobacteraceae bacterium]